MSALESSQEAEHNRERRTLSEADAYRHVSVNMTFGIMRLLHAQNFFLQMQLKTIKEYGPTLSNPERQLFDDIESFAKDPDGVRPVSIAVRFSYFQYVTRIGYLVYATTLFDSFLSDTTRFLLLRNPNALGEDCRVPIGVLVSPTARAKVINEEIARKVRALASHNGFEQRLDFLKSRFDMKFDVSPHVAELRRLSDLRNKLVHDESIYGFELDESQRNTIVAKGDFFAPAKITDNDVTNATDTYQAVFRQVYRSVLRDVLHVPDEDPFKQYDREKATEP